MELILDWMSPGNKQPHKKMAQLQIENLRFFNKKETGPRSKGVPVTPETYPPTLSQSAKVSCRDIAAVD